MKFDFVAYPTKVKDILHISSEKRIQLVTVYNIQGKIVKDQTINGNEISVSLAEFLERIYFVRVYLRAAVKIVKE
ncbi:T9SS type A sorting domain-containing protein [Pontibacter harenae]|uniref:T9SS type A sorting domain-containing protein n=1 Tax=Pontibacter harenae TaxID=2894083 RepID=UPI001E2AE858|nr:T9SS type A sorting domain-containing protein [Pontibacter harenae]